MASQQKGWVVKDWVRGESYYADAKKLVRIARAELAEAKAQGIPHNINSADLNSGKLAMDFLNRSGGRYNVRSSAELARESKTFDISTASGMKEAETYYKSLVNKYNTVDVKSSGWGKVTVKGYN